MWCKFFFVYSVWSVNSVIILSICQSILNFIFGCLSIWNVCACLPVHYSISTSHLLSKSHQISDAICKNSGSDKWISDLFQHKTLWDLNSPVFRCHTSFMSKGHIIFVLNYCLNSSFYWIISLSNCSFLYNWVFTVWKV